MTGNVTGRVGNTKENHKDMPTHTCYKAEMKNKTMTAPSAQEDAEKPDLPTMRMKREGHSSCRRCSGGVLKT